MEDGLNYLSSDWGNIEEIVLYGFGLYGPARIVLKDILRDFKVKAIIDNDPEKIGSVVEGIPIISLECAYELLKKYKVVVSTYTNAYMVISSVLQEKGLKEYRDYCSLERFLVEWNYRFRNKVHLLELHTSVTTRCTLKCKNCNMFMPYHKTTVDYSFEQIKKEIDLLFSYVDYIHIYEWVGGEPFLNEELVDILKYICENYGGRIGRLGLITNGTVLPRNKEIWEILRKNKIWLSISDYSHRVEYGLRLKTFIDTLEENDIKYAKMDLSKWKDYGFPVTPRNYVNTRSHMLSCNPMFQGYNDFKLYYCHVSWAAEKGGLYSLQESDYLDLLNVSCDKEIMRRDILRYSLAEMEEKTLSLCRYCGGCSSENKVYVDAAIQKE